MGSCQHKNCIILRIKTISGLIEDLNNLFLYELIHFISLEAMLKVVS